MFPELNLRADRPLGSYIKKAEAYMTRSSSYLTSSPVQVCLNKLTSDTSDEPLHTLSTKVKM